MADLWVFDFDGTLVETAALKRAAFFTIFPDRHASVVEATLARWPDASRHEVIPQMVSVAADLSLDPAALVASYGAAVAQAVRAARPVEGAEAAVARAASDGIACLFSMTPHDELIAAVEARGWRHWFSEIRGYPARKPDTLSEWITRFAANRTTVIGDGESDAEAARLNGVAFLRADAGWPQRMWGYART